ncbi:MAG: hypothetical protein E7359_00255 [Clostridiales bacterium]|nr:hypothetical protein [Clostridiales bacterium]
MEYLRPAYIDKLPERFKHYFSEENFKDRPYPQTLENANNYLLHEVFKADTTEYIILFEVDKDGNPTEKMTDFTRDNFYKIFNYSNWSKLHDEAKIVALYWFYEGVCEELKIDKPKFYFLDTNDNMNENIGAYYMPTDHSFHMFLLDQNCEEAKSAYYYIDIIAHELKHAQFASKKQTEYLNRLNYVHYFDLPDEKDYKLDEDREKFEFNYALALYYQQPNEVESYNYGMKKAKEIFKEANFRVKNGKITKEIKDSASLVDLNFFRNVNFDRRQHKKLFEFIFQGEFKEHLDKHFLLRELSKDLENITYEILELDPNAKFENDTIEFIVDTQEKADLYNKLLEAREYFYQFHDEIEQDKKKMFKRYKQILADESVVEYHTK